MPATNQLEIKRIPIAACKLAPSETADVMEFTGYGAAFGNVDSYGDMIQKGAFSDYLDDVKTGKQNWPAMLMQHGGWGIGANDMTPVGIYTALSEDDIGLNLSGKLADTSLGIDVYKLMKMQPRPALDGLSIGYYVKDLEYGGKSDPYERLIKKIDLVEISIVTFPANGNARISGVKSARDMTEREFEQLLRDSGLSKKDAQIVISHGFRAIVDVRDSLSDELKAIHAALSRNINIFTQQ